MPAPAPARTPPDTRTDGITHLYCCDPDLALCGTDIADLPEVDEDGHLCVVCDDLVPTPCPHCAWHPDHEEAR